MRVTLPDNVGLREVDSLGLADLVSVGVELLDGLLVPLALSLLERVTL